MTFFVRRYLEKYIEQAQASVRPQTLGEATEAPKPIKTSAHIHLNEYINEIIDTVKQLQPISM